MTTFKKINALVNEDHHRTIDQLSEMSGVSWSSVQRIGSITTKIHLPTLWCLKQFLTKNGVTSIVHPNPLPLFTKPSPL
ncbi:unnamed protein product [Nezara viridula]|uniref:Uncharacterized protein n=1 Tax=Nezara viridula TaxID=85310 RepID=A0A9P0EEB8_NEZVI|nr:unnamed protein product [Nezara viridula]